MYTPGLHVTEVAHDFQVQVSRYVMDELGLQNSYDTWHGKLTHTYTSTCTHTCTIQGTICSCIFVLQELFADLCLRVQYCVLLVHL